MSGYTYAIQAVEGGPIKIGSTKGSPQARLSQLQIGSPKRLRIIAVLEGRHRERDLHLQFRDYRLHGEWFRADAPWLMMSLDIYCPDGRHVWASEPDEVTDEHTRWVCRSCADMHLEPRHQTATFPKPRHLRVLTQPLLA